MPILGGRLGRLLDLWEQLGEYADEIIEVVPLLRELRLAHGVQAKAAIVVKIAKLFTDEIPGDIDDRAIELVEEFLKPEHAVIVDKAEALLRSVGILKSEAATDAPPAFGF